MTSKQASTTTRVVGYVRLSDASKEESTSIARQNEIIERTARDRGFTLIDIVPDEDVSASKKRLDRPGLTKVRQMLRTGEADAVLVWRLDRLARSVGDIATLLDEGVVPVSCTEPIDATSAMGRAMVEISQVFAGLEARAISDRVTASIAYLKTQGRWSGGNTPYGYMSAPNPDGSGRILVPNPEEVAVVQEVARRVLEGESTYAVAIDLNRRGVRPRKSTSPGWLPKTIDRMLTSDAILGRYTHHGEVIRDETGMPKQVWEPVLDLAVWHRLRDRLGVDMPKADRQPRQRRRSSKLLSGGLLRCGVCGFPMYVKVGSKSTSPWSYFCASRFRGRTCPGNSIAGDHLDRYVEDRFLATLGDREVMVRNVEASASETDLADVEAAIRATTTAMTEDEADVLALAERLASLKTRRTLLRQAPSEPVVRLVGSGETIREAWERAELPQRRELLAANLAVLSINKATRRGKAGSIATERVVLVGQPLLAADYVEADVAVNNRAVA